MHDSNSRNANAFYNCDDDDDFVQNYGLNWNESNWIVAAVFRRLASHLKQCDCIRLEFARR